MRDPLKGFWGRNPLERERLRQRHEYVRLCDLKEWKDNPRHNEDAVPQLMKLIQEHGWAGMIVATPDGVIRAGHTRFKAVKKLGHDRIWVHWKNFPSEKAAEAFALADNKSSEWSTWDHAKLARLFKKRLSVDVQRLTGFQRSQIEWGGVKPVDVSKIKVDEEDEEEEFTLRIMGVRGRHLKALHNEFGATLKKFNLKHGSSYEINVY